MVVFCVPMGNGIGKLTVCFTGNGGGGRRKQDISILITEPLDEGLGHSFCYVRPDPTRISSSKVHSEETTTFRTIKRVTEELGAQKANDC